MVVPLVVQEVGGREQRGERRSQEEQHDPGDDSGEFGAWADGRDERLADGGFVSVARLSSGVQAKGREAWGEGGRTAQPKERAAWAPVGTRPPPRKRQAMDCAATQLVPRATSCTAVSGTRGGGNGVCAFCRRVARWQFQHRFWTRRGAK